MGPDLSHTEQAVKKPKATAGKLLLTKFSQYLACAGEGTEHSSRHDIRTDRPAVDPGRSLLL
jgi:hypothetical protein